ncbi:MAG: methyltransferase domain-containing protein [Pseudomonadota bacterium]
MPKKPGLDAAYALGGADDVKALYADWAQTYDSGFVAALGYQLHQAVGEAYAAAGGRGPVLDVGAGTGLVGEVLAAAGIGPVEGTDISAEMLAAADAKGVYARTFVADVTTRLPIEDNHYAGVVSAGTFTLGHLGPAPLAELVRITAPGGLFAIAVNAAHYEAAGFGAFLSGDLAGAITDLSLSAVRIYAEGATHDHADDGGLILTFRVA